MEKEAKFKEYKLNDNQIKKLDLFKLKLEKTSNVTSLYEELSGIIENMQKIGNTFANDEDLHVEMWKARILISKLGSSVSSHADNAYFLSEARNWIDSHLDLNGFSLNDLSKFVRILVSAPIPKWLDMAHRLILYFLKNYKDEIYKDEAKENKEIALILSTFFKATYEYMIPYLNNDDMREIVSNWVSDIVAVFDITILINKIYPENEKIHHKMKGLSALSYYEHAYFLMNVFRGALGEKERSIFPNNALIFTKEYDGKFPIVAIPKFFNGKVYEIDKVDSSFPYALELNYLINLFCNIRENVISDKFESCSSFDMEAVLVSLVSLAEKNYFTFTHHLLNDKTERLMPSQISAISQKNWDLLKAELNKVEKLEIFSDIKVSFMTTSFIIWNDNYLGQGYKSKSKSLRNIIVHRNPMMYEGYSKDGLKSEILRLLPMVSNQISILVTLFSLLNIKDNELPLEKYHHKVRERMTDVEFKIWSYKNK